MEEFKILDSILNQLEKSTEQEPIKMEKLFWEADKLFETSPRLRFTVMNKLVNDGYAEHKEIIDSKTGIVNSTYFLTYDGLLLNKFKGYAEKYRIEKRKRISKRVLDYTLAVSIFFSGIITSIYYLKEMTKNPNSHPSKCLEKESK